MCWQAARAAPIHGIVEVYSSLHAAHHRRVGLVCDATQAVDPAPAADGHRSGPALCCRYRFCQRTCIENTLTMIIERQSQPSARQKASARTAHISWAGSHCDKAPSKHCDRAPPLLAKKHLHEQHISVGLAVTVTKPLKAL